MEDKCTLGASKWDTKNSPSLVSGSENLWGHPLQFAGLADCLKLKHLLICLDKFIVFFAEQCFAWISWEWVGHAVQNLIKVNTVLALHLQLHYRVQFELDALISPILYIFSEILIIDVTINYIYLPICKKCTYCQIYFKVSVYPKIMTIIRWCRFVVSRLMQTQVNYKFSQSLRIM